MSMSIA